MKLIINKTANGTVNTATSQCGRYAWHCKAPVAKKNNIKSNMNHATAVTK
ncbi:hypothetical protein SIN8267_02046 [Sinobacterium norvegicum]|uniref:Uncharacterized protein n=1 Tax=Sinobacterium norvegicum TaxID=1641715 RepID=A0ABM9AFF8_9GAMM|nr:hypothetical protein [Sinobacterium norvegicum]CAH0991931.1 hypothetical protein SIN8267_02046 [Sinobacterium norvegicum]